MPDPTDLALMADDLADPAFLPWFGSNRDDPEPQENDGQEWEQREEADQ